MVTAAVFGLIVAAHGARVWAEGAWLATDPFFAAVTLLSAALCGWGGWLTWRSRG